MRPRVSPGATTCTTVAGAGRGTGGRDDQDLAHDDAVRIADAVRLGQGPDGRVVPCRDPRQGLPRRDRVLVSAGGDRSQCQDDQHERREQSNLEVVGAHMNLPGSAREPQAQHTPHQPHAPREHPYPHRRRHRRESRVSGLGQRDQAAGFGAALGVEALEAGLGRVVDVAHHLGHGVVAGLLGDEPVHLLGDGPVGGVALRGAAQLDQVHRRPGVEIEDEPDLVGQAHGVAGLTGNRSARVS